MALDFSMENLINNVHSEHVLQDINVDASGEEEELAWCRVASTFGFVTHKQALNP